MDLSYVLKPKTEGELPTIQEIMTLFKKSIKSSREHEIEKIKEALDAIDKHCKNLREKEWRLKLNYNFVLLPEEIKDLGTRFIVLDCEGEEKHRIIIGDNYGLAELIYSRLKMKESCEICGGLPKIYKKKHNILCPGCLGTGENDRLNPSCDFGIPLIYIYKDFRLIYLWNEKHNLNLSLKKFKK